MRGHDALRFARRAARVEDHRAAIGRDLRQRLRRCGGDGFDVDQSHAEPFTHRRDLRRHRRHPPSRRPHRNPSGRIPTPASPPTGRCGTLIPPARQMAHCAAEYSNPGGTSSATRVSFKSSCIGEQRRRERRGAVEQVPIGVQVAAVRNATEPAWERARAMSGSSGMVQRPMMALTARKKTDGTSRQPRPV